MRRRVRQHRRQAPERGFRGAKAARSANAWAPLHGAASLQRPSSKPKDVTKELCGSQPRALDSRGCYGLGMVRLEALYALAIHTGMRRGELLALRWSDVSLEETELGVVRVHRTL